MYVYRHTQQDDRNKAIARVAQLIADEPNNNPNELYANAQWTTNTTISMDRKKQSREGTFSLKPRG